ncbi:MAG: guanine deaminase [Paracoccaceae bacterium]|nr:guanine deaminase [Paracoccaceae bacterium]
MTGIGTSLILGQTVELIADPFHASPDATIRYRRRGGVRIHNGRIERVGEADALCALDPTVPVTDFGDSLILPGFVDCHAHYPQTGIIASWGRRLIDWLNDYTFPEEMHFGDPSHSRTVADRYLDLCLANGTTTACVYCTVHPESVDAFFEAAAARNLRVAAGKVMMDQNAPDGLCDTVRKGYEQSRALIDRWHGRGRALYAVTPRFAPTSSPEQLAAAGALWAETPGVLLQTHLSEQIEEVAWVRRLFPDSTDYVAVYENHGLTGPGAIMGHAIHLSDRERRALAETGTGVAHCPTSNTFIGSGLCDVAGLRRLGIGVGLATDVGGGSSFSMLTTMRTAYEVSQLRGEVLHPAQLLWLATVGSADVMGLTGVVGRLAPGADADLCVLDPTATPVLAQRTRRAESIRDLLFALIMLGDDRAVRAVYVAGQPALGAVPIGNLDPDSRRVR